MGAADDHDNQFRIEISSKNKPFFTRKTGTPFYRNTDTGRMAPQEVYLTRADVLDLSDPSDYKLYQMIWSSVGLRTVRILDEEKEWSATKENWKVNIRWAFTGQMETSELRAEVASKVSQLYAAVQAQDKEKEPEDERDTTGNLFDARG